MHAWLSDTSAITDSASTPRDSHCSTTNSAALREFVQVIVTFHPLDAKSSAVAFPTPLLPPVMMATGFWDFDIRLAFFVV
jgi:hypothetical protein